MEFFLIAISEDGVNSGVSPDDCPLSSAAIFEEFDGAPERLVQ